MVGWRRKGEGSGDGEIQSERRTKPDFFSRVASRVARGGIRSP